MVYTGFVLRISPQLKLKEVRPMNKKEKRIAVRQTAEKAVIRDGQDRRIQLAGHLSIPLPLSCFVWRWCPP